MALDPTAADRPHPERPGVRIGAVVSRFHEDLTGAMLRSAREELVAAGMEEGPMPPLRAESCRLAEYLG